ncbi:MAG TPA: hypothetical protein PK760_15530, partial [Flavobacteriales bacterium]|nr:hypothetical protein [Flavobacteriales bacterium]
QLSHPPTYLDRFAWFLSGIGIRSKALRTTRLEDINHHLMVKALSLPANATAREFQPILERATQVPPEAWSFLATEPGGRKVLVDSEHLKVVLIRWEPGAECARHYHPNGGGMIMVLEGAILESRFLNGTIAAPYEVRNMQRHVMSYIDDTLGAHVVANPHERAAITLHAYLKHRPVGAA